MLNQLEKIKCLPKELIKYIIIFTLALCASYSADNGPHQKKVTVNLMWINKDMSKDIFPNLIERFSREAKKNIKIDTFQRIEEWAKYYPVNVWYDSEFTTHESRVITQNSFNERCKKSLNPSCSINLKDIRDLQTVKNNLDVFTRDNTVYFRADLLRVIAAYETLLKNKNYLFVYADFSITPMSNTELLDKSTIKNLNEYGMVMAKGAEIIQYENSFQIIGNNKEELLAAINLAIIQANIERFRAYKKMGKNIQDLAQTVYTTYETMFQLYYAYEGKAELICDGMNINHIPLKKVKENLLNWLGHDNVPRLGLSCTFKIVNPDLNYTINQGTIENPKLWNRMLIPLKEGSFPKSHFGS